MAASDSHNPPDARVRELEADVSRLREQRDAIVENGVTSTFNLALELSEAQAENARLREALSVAADDLDKAANQFEGIRQAQKAGHEVQVVSNSRVFAAKAQRAREALEAGER